MPVLEHGRRGQSNTYDLAAVVAWIKKHGRGATRFPSGGRQPVDIAALERELQGLDEPTKQAVGDLYVHVVKKLFIRYAAKLYARHGGPMESMLDDLADLNDVLWTTFIERCGDTDPEHDSLVNWLYDPADPARPGMIERIYQAAADERAKCAPELELGASAQTRAQQDPPDGNQVELQVLAKLTELVGEIRALRAELKAPHDEKAVKLEALLAAIHGELGEAPWPAAWLIDDGDLMTAVCEIIGKRKAKSGGTRLGIFLSKNVGVTGRWRLDIARADTRDGNLYSVRPVTLRSQASHGIAGAVE